ncbi:MAG: molecular chaperone Tir [Paludibacteraceae bacterium]|nr:molecular chaperone Tir [Paludibacteraceae bacterium]
MAITDRIYRTCTYIAGDWDNDNDAVNQLKKWNESDKWGLTFNDVHELTQSRDSSLNCSIKKSLRNRMNICKTFVLIVGEKTNSLRSGACFLCSEYVKATMWASEYCRKGYSIDNCSYVETECTMAASDNAAGKIKIIVLYKDTKVDRSKCPADVRWRGTHVSMIYKGNDGTYYWDYSAVKQAFDNL